MRLRHLLVALMLLLVASQAWAQSVIYDHGASATAKGAGAAGVPSSLTFNVTAGQNRILFLMGLFERDHCRTNTGENNVNCSVNDWSAAGNSGNNNFAAPDFVSVNLSGNGYSTFQFTVTGPGGSLTLTHPLGGGLGQYAFVQGSGLITGATITPQAAAYSTEGYPLAVYESQLRTLLGGATTGTLTITLPNVDLPNRAGDEALLAGIQFNNTHQLSTGAAGTGIVRSLLGNTWFQACDGFAYTLGFAPFNWATCPDQPAAYDPGQAPLTANDGVLLVGFNGFSRATPDGFLASPGFTQKMNPRVLNNDPSTSGIAGAHVRTRTESDGFSTTFQFANGSSSTLPATSIRLQSQNDSLISGQTTTGGWIAVFTLTAATLDLSITKTDGKTTTGPGDTNTYTVVATNTSTVDFADGAVVTDSAATGLTKTGVTCTTTGGAVCPAGLTVALLESGATIPTFPPLSTVTFTVTTTVSSTPAASVTNTTTIATPAGYSDTNTANNTASDTDTLLPSVTVAKTVSGGSGTNTFDYTLTGVTNTTDTTANVPVGGTVTSTTPHVGTIGTAASTTETSATSPTLSNYTTTWACSDSHSATTGNGNFSGAGTAISLTGTQMSAGAAWICTYTNTRKSADVKVVKTVSPNTAVPPGQVVTYTLTATNNGPDGATNALLSDTASAGLDCTTPSATAMCSATGGASCPGATVAVSDLLGAGVTIPTFPVAGEIVVTMQCTVTATGSQ